MKDFVCKCLAFSLQRGETSESTETSATDVPSLDSFKLRTNDYDTQGRSGLDVVVQLGMSDKKQHEVACMADIVDRVMNKSLAEVVVDAGSGLVSDRDKKNATW